MCCVPLCDPFNRRRLCTYTYQRSGRFCFLLVAGIAPSGWCLSHGAAQLTAHPNSRADRLFFCNPLQPPSLTATTRILVVTAKMSSAKYTFSHFFGAGKGLLFQGRQLDSPLLRRLCSFLYFLRFRSQLRIMPEDTYFSAEHPSSQTGGLLG